MTKRVFRKLPLLVLGVLLTACGQQGPGSHNEQGNQLFDQEQYGPALREYQEAESLAPDRPEPQGNAGNVKYQLEDYLGALDEYRAAMPLAEPAMQATLYYNLGNAHFRGGEIPQAIEAYKQSLRLNPDDVDAKYNLELAQRQQEQQQPEEGEGEQGQQPPPEGEEEDPEAEANGGGQEQRPEPPPARMSPGEAERRLDEFRRQEDSLADETYRDHQLGDEGNGTQAGEPERDW
jgi:Ca-activated chloride channel homolog